MTKYYSAIITLSTENLELNPETGVYEGCDPDTFQDHGQIYKFEGTLDSVKAQIKRTLVGLDKWEYDEYSQTLTWSCDGEHDYRTPFKDRVPYMENWTLYLTEVQETTVDPRILSGGEL